MYHCVFDKASKRFTGSATLDQDPPEFDPAVHVVVKCATLPNRMAHRVSDDGTKAVEAAAAEIAAWRQKRRQDRAARALATDAQLRLLAGRLLDLENRLRALEGKQGIDASTFKSALVAELEPLVPDDDP